MDVHGYLEVLRRRWLSALIVALLVLAAAASVSLLSTPRFTATTRLFFSVEGSGSVSDLAQGSNFAENQIVSYAEVATSPLVLQPVIAELQLPMTAAELARQVTAVVPTQTVVLEIAVTDPDAVRATSIANAIGAEVAQVTGTLSPKRADGSDAVRATTLAPAQVPTVASSPRIVRNLLIGLVLGLVLGLAVALLRNVIDTKVRSESDVRALTDRAVLGVIAFDDKVPQHPVILRDDPQSAAAESVRRLRTNLQFVGVAEDCRALVVTSSVPGEGKSTAAINLAVALADAGSRVLLIDADLRRPSIAGYLGLEGRVGLTTVLRRKAAVEDVVQPYGDTSLDVLPAGQIPPNPSELLGSAAMRTLLAEVTSAYDLVLIDSPPVLPVTDGAVLGRQVGGALVVVGVDRIHRPQLRETLESLETAGCPVLGLVINKIARREVGAYVYERGYYSSAEDPDGEPTPAPADRELEPPRPAADERPRIRV